MPQVDEERGDEHGEQEAEQHAVPAVAELPDGSGEHEAHQKLDAEIPPRDRRAAVAALAAG